MLEKMAKKITATNDQLCKYFDKPNSIAFK